MKLSAFLSVLSLIAISACGDNSSYSQCDFNSFQESSKVIISDEMNRFSVSIPKNWDVKKKQEQQSSDVLIRAACGTTILISSRPLDSREVGVNPEVLASAMLNGLLKQIKDSGHSVVNFGKYPSIKSNFPTFSIVSQDKGVDRPTIHIGAISESKILSIIAIGKGNYDGDISAEILKKTIETIRML